MQTIEEILFNLYNLDFQIWVENPHTASPKLRFNAPEEVITQEIIELLKENKAEIINFLNQTNHAQKSHLPPIQPISREEEIPLSFAQERLWFLEQLQPETSAYNLPTAVRLTGELQVNLFDKAIQEIVRRHEILRTNFVMVDEQATQVIHPSLNLNIPTLNLQNISSSEQEIEIKKIATQEAQKPFNLTQDPLLRITLLHLQPQEYVVLLTMHHIIFDGWSMEVLIQELVSLYTAFCQEKPSPLPELTIQYADFAVWQRQWLQGKVLKEQLSYWKKHLGSNPSVLQLPTDFPRGKVQSFRGANQTFSLSSELTASLTKLAQSSGVTLFMLLLTAYKVMLYRYTGQQEIIVGSPIANRNRSQVEGLIGFFVNTLVLRSEIHGSLSFRELLAQVKQATLAAYDHQDLPFEKLVAELQPDRDLSYNALFQVKFRLENPPTQEIKLPNLSLKSLNQINSTAKIDLSLDMYETPTGLVGGFEYNQDLFEAATINHMVEHFRTLLIAIVNNPSQCVANLPLLSQLERNQILEEWNNTAIEFDQDLCFHELFETQVAKNPQAIAIIFEDEEITYQELNQRSNQLANYLQKLGVKPEVKVGICVERSPKMIVALLAVFKAGGAYLPLDPTYPQERLKYMVEDSGIKILLTQQNLDVMIKADSKIKTVYLDSQKNEISQESDLNLHNRVARHYAAYLIYTSGSTGKPKGVLVTHEGIVNLTQHKLRACEVTPDSCILQFFSFSFDASIPEIIMALGSGAKLCLAKPESLLPGADLLQLLREKAVTHITITPSALATVTPEELPNLRMVLVGGEAPSADLVTNWSQGRTFINAYGPTEVTVNASMVQCGNGHPIEPTIRPSDNKQLYILDSDLELVPVGILGELYIGGIGLARGYHNRPDLTAASFIPNPFQPHQRLYKTGDLACYLPNGSIKLYGRIDNQVKIRGFRLELGEIEALINSNSQVRTSVVVVREDNPGDKRLVAYFVPEPGANLTVNEIRNFCADKLPKYMIPNLFVSLEALPLSPNGKIDKKALPTQEASILRNNFAAPRNLTEEILVEIFSQVLEVEVGIYDDFFELGGHSLLATKLVAAIINKFGVGITIIDLFETPTVAGLGVKIEQQETRENVEDTQDDVEEREEVEF